MEMPSLCSWGHQRVLAEREEDGPVDEERRRARDLNLNHSATPTVAATPIPGTTKRPIVSVQTSPLIALTNTPALLGARPAFRRRVLVVVRGHRAVTYRPIAVPHTLGERRLSGVPKLGMTSIRSGDISRRTSVNDTLRRSQKRKDASFVLHLLHGIERETSAAAAPPQPGHHHSRRHRGRLASTCNGALSYVSPERHVVPTAHVAGNQRPMRRQAQP